MSKQYKVNPPTEQYPLGTITEILDIHNSKYNYFGGMDEYRKDLLSSQSIPLTFKTDKEVLEEGVDFKIVLNCCTYGGLYSACERQCDNEGIWVAAPQNKTNEFVWDDDKVIDFINWYIELKGIGDRYTLENRFIIESFKNGDNPNIWNNKSLIK